MKMTTQLDSSNEMCSKVNLIGSLYLYSDLSVEHIARMLKMETDQVKKIVEKLIRKNTPMEIYEQINTPVEQIMQRDVAILDVSKSALDAATMMIKKGVGCVLVVSQGKPYGMVTERDMLCEMTVFDKKLADLLLEVISSRPLVQVSPLETVRDVADLMVKNSIRRVPVVQDDSVLGMVVAKDIVGLLSSVKRRVYQMPNLGQSHDQGLADKRLF